jgi:PilZ domain
MPWISASPQKPAAPSATASLEFVTMVSARGIAPANAVVEHLTASECRFRTVVFFDHGDVIEFEFGIEPSVLVRGSVASRTAKGPRFEYRMRLDRMSAKEIDLLAFAVTQSHRRQAIARSNQRSISKLPTTERLTRESVRVLAQFPMMFRTSKEDFKPAKAGDVSTGGLLMTCGVALVEGMPVELRFTLPSDVLKIYPEETLAIDLRSQTVVSRSRPDPRRRFEEMVIGARVVSHQPVGNGTYRYGLAFTSIDGFQQEEIARYTHASQRSKARR